MYGQSVRLPLGRGLNDTSEWRRGQNKGGKHVADMWIRIRIKLKGRIRIRSKYAGSGSALFADDKQKCMEYEAIRVLFQGFEPLFGN